MPRTKVTKITKNKPDEEGIDKKLLFAGLLEERKNFEYELKQLQANLSIYTDEFWAGLLGKTRSTLLNLKLCDLEKITSLSLDSTVAIASNKSLLNPIKSSTKSKNTISRSSSFDEGYLTTESSRSVSSASQKSRGRTKTLRPSERRMTRSLSRNSTHRFCTPSNKGKPEEFGAITPKCKPNSAQILMRRPKKGEIALSFKGSPLLVNGIAEDITANINIPLDDGSMLSLLPQRGLRMSQIPPLDSEMLRQLETLHQHIDMVLNKNG